MPFFENRIFAETLLRKLGQLAPEAIAKYPSVFFEQVVKLVETHYPIFKGELAFVDLLTALGSQQPEKIKETIMPFAKKGELLALITLSKLKQKSRQPPKQPIKRLIEKNNYL